VTEMGLAPGLVIDLCSGYGTGTIAFREHGHTVVTVDWNPEVSPVVLADVRDLPRFIKDARPWGVWFSPDCRPFSYARHVWARYPDKTIVPEAMETIWTVLDQIRDWDPTWWLMENPRGHLQDEIGPPKFETNWCAWGKPYRKPTQFWGKFPHNLAQPCRHAVHRQRVTSTRDPTRRAEIPRAFAEAVYQAATARGPA